MKHTREHHKQWNAHIQEWHSSGKSQKAFCRENGLSYWQFRYYLKSSELYRPRKPSYKQSGNHSDFIRVEKEAIPAGWHFSTKLTLLNCLYSHQPPRAARTRRYGATPAREGRWSGFFLFTV